MERRRKTVRLDFDDVLVSSMNVNGKHTLLFDFETGETLTSFPMPGKNFEDELKDWRRRKAFRNQSPLPIIIAP